MIVAISVQNCNNSLHVTAMTTPSLYDQGQRDFFTPEKNQGNRLPGYW